MPKPAKSKSKEESDEEVDLGSEIDSEPEELDLETDIIEVNAEDAEHSEPEINPEDLEDSDSEQEHEQDSDVVSNSNVTTKTTDYHEPKNIKERPAFAIIKIVKPEERKSTHVLQQTEYARIIGLRAVQLEKKHKPRVKVTPGMTLYDIAKQELFEKKISFIIRRYVNATLAEDWSTSEMDINPTRFCTTN